MEFAHTDKEVWPTHKLTRRLAEITLHLEGVICITQRNSDIANEADYILFELQQKNVESGATL